MDFEVGMELSRGNGSMVDDGRFVRGCREWLVTSEYGMSKTIEKWKMVGLGNVRQFDSEPSTR